MANVVSQPTTGINIYGSGNDLSSAMTKYNGTKGVNFVDTSSPNFDSSTMSNGIMLGGTGVNKNITDNVLKNAGVQRIWGVTGADTTNALNNYMSSYGKASTPTNTAFSYTGNMQDYLDQAQTALKPQYDLTVKNINTNYDTNLIPQANNDTLSRGLARSSYAGNRVDQVNAARTTDLTNAAMQQQQQVNNLAMQNYNTGYDRAYKVYQDQNANAWNTYNAQNDDYWKDKNWQQSQDQWNWQQIKDKNDENWKKQNQANWQSQFDNSNNQWKTTFDYNKEKDQKAYDLQLQQLALSAAKAASGGGRGSSGSSAASKAAATANQTAIDKAAYANFNSLSTPQDQYALLQNPDFVNSVSQATYKALQSQYQKSLKDSGLSQSLVQSSEPTWNYSDSPYTVYSGGR